MLTVPPLPQTKKPTGRRKLSIDGKRHHVFLLLLFNFPLRHRYDGSAPECMHEQQTHVRRVAFFSLSLSKSEMQLQTIDNRLTEQVQARYVE